MTKLYTDHLCGVSKNEDGVYRFTKDDGKPSIAITCMVEMFVRYTEIEHDQNFQIKQVTTRETSGAIIGSKSRVSDSFPLAYKEDKLAVKPINAAMHHFKVAEAIRREQEEAFKTPEGKKAWQEQMVKNAQLGHERVGRRFAEFRKKRGIPEPE